MLLDSNIRDHGAARLVTAAAEAVAVAEPAVRREPPQANQAIPHAATRSAVTVTNQAGTAAAAALANEPVNIRVSTRTKNKIQK